MLLDSIGIGRMPMEKQKDLTDRIADAHRDAGVPAVFIHNALHFGREVDRWHELTGLKSRRHTSNRPREVRNLAPDHPIMRDFGETWTPATVELYRVEDVSPLWATGKLDDDGNPLPEVLVDEASEPGDDHATLQPRVEKLRHRDGPVMELTGDREFRGGVVVDGGRIVLIRRTGEVIFTPFDSVHVGIYAPNKNVYVQDAPHQAGTTAAYSGIAELADGTMVMALRNARHIGRYDPTTRKFAKGPEHGEGAAAFMAAQRWPNGPVVMAPYRASHVGIYDPSTEQYRSGPSVTHVPVLSHGQRFSIAILTASGDRVIMSNRDADRLGIIEFSEQFEIDDRQPE